MTHVRGLDLQVSRPSIRREAQRRRYGKDRRGQILWICLVIGRSPDTGGSPREWKKVATRASITFRIEQTAQRFDGAGERWLSDVVVGCTASAAGMRRARRCSSWALCCSGNTLVIGAEMLLD